MVDQKKIKFEHPLLGVAVSLSISVFILSIQTFEVFHRNLTVL